MNFWLLVGLIVFAHSIDVKLAVTDTDTPADHTIIKGMTVLHN